MPLNKNTFYDIMQAGLANRFSGSLSAVAVGRYFGGLSALAVLAAYSRRANYRLNR